MKTTDQPQVKQYVIYSRKSKFTGKGESIENQIELCRQYIAMHFGEDEAEHALVYEDEGFSGGNLERPQFKQMMKDSQKIEFAAIVVYRLDRISRNIGDFAKLIEDLGDRHIDFISIREQFDTSSPMGRAMMYIASVFSQLERETIAERIRDNMHELSKTGRWLGGTTPTGYASESLSSVTVDGKVKKACKLKPIPEEIQLVKTIFSVFTESGSLSKTDQYLLEHRCVTKRGKQFTRFAIRGILTNPVYMIADDTAYQYLKENNVDLFAEPSEFDGEHGIMAYNRTLQRPGKATQIRPMEDWIVAVGKHPGIISGANWVRVQSMLDVNKSKSYRKPRSNVALLSGLLRCGECGDYMRPKLTGRTNANGELIYTYMCSTKERSHGTVCSMKNCNGNTLDAKIVEEIRKVATDKKDFGQLLSKTKKVINDNKASYEAELTLLVKNHAETEARIKRLVESLSVASETSAKYVMEQIDELHRQSEQEQTRIAELEKLARQSNALSQNLFFYRDMIESFADTVDSTTIEERRRLLRTIVKKVVWDGKNVYVYLFAEDGELNLPPIGQLMSPSGEDSEYYTNIAELSEDEVAKQAPFGAKWRLLAQVEVRCYILISNRSGSVKVAPLQILQFPVILPHKFQDAEKFNLQFSDFSEITETADKLRWLRYQKGLRQRDVADYAGIYRSTYIHYEEYGKDFYSPKHMEKIAQLFEVPVERLLDDYNLFLRNGQGKQIKAIRMKLGLTQREYADKLGISLCNLKQWEQNRKQLFKSTWEKYFK